MKTNLLLTTAALMLFAAPVLALFGVGRAEIAVVDWAPEFGKVILYYFLLLAVVDTRARFRTFVASLVVYIAVLDGIALAQFYGHVNFASIQPVMQRKIDKVTGQETIFPRMVSAGVFRVWLRRELSSAFFKLRNSGM